MGAIFTVQLLLILIFWPATVGGGAIAPFALLPVDPPLVMLQKRLLPLKSINTFIQRLLGNSTAKYS